MAWRSPSQPGGMLVDSTSVLATVEHIAQPSSGASAVVHMLLDLAGEVAVLISLPPGTQNTPMDLAQPGSKLVDLEVVMRAV